MLVGRYLVLVIFERACHFWTEVLVASIRTQSTTTTRGNLHVSWCAPHLCPDRRLWARQQCVDELASLGVKLEALRSHPETQLLQLGVFLERVALMLPPQQLPMLWSYIPKRAVESYTQGGLIYLPPIFHWTARAGTHASLPGEPSLSILPIGGPKMYVCIYIYIYDIYIYIHEKCFKNLRWVIWIPRVCHTLEAQLAGWQVPGP